MHTLLTSIVFLSDEILILNMNTNQGIHKIDVLVSYLPFRSLIFIIKLMSLYGFPFFFVIFLIKDIIFVDFR